MSQVANSSMVFSTNNTTALEITNAQHLVPAGQIRMKQTQKLMFDGDSSQHTYIYESADDILDFYVGNYFGDSCGLYVKNLSANR